MGGKAMGGYWARQEHDTAQRHNGNEVGQSWGPAEGNHSRQGRGGVALTGMKTNTTHHHWHNAVPMEGGAGR